MPEITPPVPSFAPEGVEHAGGDIKDPVRVLRLAYYQTTIEKIKANQEKYRLLFDDQIRNLQVQRHNVLLNLQNELRTADHLYRALQEEIEQVHKINLANYTFDPDTGAFNKVGGDVPASSEAGSSEVAPPPAQ